MSGVTPGATLMLDASGRVTQASARAGGLWKMEAEKIVGQPLASLFHFDVVTAGTDGLEAHWEVLLASALNRMLPLEAQPATGAPVPVTLHLEHAIGTAPGFLASICPAAPTTGAAGSLQSLDASLPIHSARSPVGFFDLYFKTGQIHYSPAWKRILGYADHELENTYDSWLRLIHPEDSGAAPDQVGRPPAGGGSKAFSVEFRMKHQRGHWVWIHSSGTQIFNASGELERVMGVHVDITERKEVEEESLLADERLLRLTGDGAVAAFDLNFADQRFWFSRAWLRLAGIEHDAEAEHRLETLTDRLPSYVMEGGVENFFLAPATGQPSFVVPLSLRRKDGTECMVQLGGHRQLSRKRELVRVVGYAVPIPVAAAATAAGASKIPLIEDAFAALGEAVLVTDASGTVIFLNPKAEELTGCSLADARKLKMNDVLQLVARSDGRSAADAVELMLASETEPRLHSDHALVPMTGGEPIPITWTAREAKDEDGKPKGVIAVFRNPQEMTLTPEELIRSNRFESLGQVAGGIAHDFNNFLTTILGSISLAKDNRDYSGLGDGEKACMAAKGLTKQLLAFAKGSAAATHQVLAPAELLRDAVRVATAGSPVRIHLDVDDDAGPVAVDRGQMIQVFQNLIINSVQAMPSQESGEIWLRCVNTELKDGQLPPLAAGRYVQMDVQDNGSGIPAEVIDRIFDPFFTTKQSGTGLGLATVLSIVRRHGGQLGVDSTPGTGTTFTVYLPKADRPVDTEARRAPALRFGTGRILFMDDDPKICELTGNMLASLDYTYDVARHGEEALSLYRRYLNVSRPYDAVVMDLTIIGGMGGEETFRKLRELDPDVRAIVSSGYDNDEMARRFLDMGFCGYLTKPYRVTDLGRVLKGVLG